MVWRKDAGPGRDAYTSGAELVSDFVKRVARFLDAAAYVWHEMVRAPYDRGPERATQLIRAALPEVSALMMQAFDAVGHAPVPGSELDQAGLVDGAEIVEDNLAHGEAGIALEHLIYMVHEPDLPISADTYALIADAARMMNMDPALWEKMRPRS